MSINELSISVIICTRDRPKDLAHCLRSINNQSVVPEDIVIVIGSPDSCPYGIRDQFPNMKIQVLECFENNISLSRNVGLSSTQSDIVLFIDDDAVAHPGWITAYKSLFEMVPETWIAGGPVFDSRVNPPVYEFKQGMITSYGTQLPVSSKPPESLKSAYRLTVKGCNFAVRRKKALFVGGFDPFFRFAFDETDLVFAMYEANGIVQYCQDAVVDHAHTPGHYRQTGPMDHDWRVEYASHAMFILKHNSPKMQRKGRWILRRRYLKLVFTALVCVFKSKASISKGVTSLKEARLGIRDATQSIHNLSESLPR